eukprot:scaffold12676_cov112-Isochrysis_galbana.AAC.12
MHERPTLPVANLPWDFPELGWRLVPEPGSGPGPRSLGAISPLSVVRCLLCVAAAAHPSANDIAGRRFLGRQHRQHQPAPHHRSTVRYPELRCARRSSMASLTRSKGTCWARHSPSSSASRSRLSAAS